MPQVEEDYTTFDWLLLFATFLVIVLISFCFTPFTHQLDEIKNVFLQFFPPFLLAWALLLKDFRTINWKNGAPMIFLALYTAVMCFSWLINDYKLVNERVIWFHAGCATFTVIFAWFINSEAKVRKTIMFWTLLGLASSVLGILFYAGHLIGGLYDKFSAEDGGPKSPWANLFYTLLKSKDMYSFILNEDFYAAFVLMLGFIPAAMFFAEERRRYKILSLITVLLMGICMAFTYSNDTFLSAIVGIPLFAFLCLWYGFPELRTSASLSDFFGRLISPSQWTYNMKLGLTLAICFLMIAVEVFLLMLPRLYSAWTFKTEAFAGRLVLWGGDFWPWLYGKDVTRTNLDPLAIIFGVGPGGYRHYFPWHRSPDYFDNQINNVTTFGHNWYLDILLETGVVGLVLYGGFFLMMLWYAIQQIRTTKNRRLLFYQIAVVSGLVSISIQNISSPNNRWAVAGMTFWAMMGVSLGLSAMERNGGAKRDQQEEAPVIPMVTKVGSLLFALTFIIMSGLNYAWPYWAGAKLNAAGLQYMESAPLAQAAGKRIQVLERAKLYFEKAIEANPTFVTSYYKLANVYNSLGQDTEDPGYTDKAIEAYEKLNEIEPSYSEIHLNLGIMYSIKSSSILQDAQTYKAQADELMKRSAQLSGNEREELKQEAGKLREKSAAIESKAAELKIQYLEKGVDCLREAARQSLKANVQWLAASQAEQLAKYYDTMGKAEQAKQLREQAKKHYTTIITYKPKIPEAVHAKETYYKRAQESLLMLAIETGDLEEKRNTLTRLVQENPDNRRYLTELMRTYDALKRPKDKVAYLEQSAHANPTDPYLRRTLAEEYLKMDETAKYVRELRRVEVIEPLNKTALSGLYLASKDSDPAKAEAYKQKLAQIGVNADSVTTLITDQMTTAALAEQPVAKAVTASAPQTSPSETATTSAQ